jgi:hypothetical protein
MESGNRVLYAVGPIPPPSVGKGLSKSAGLWEIALSENKDGFQIFMDKILEKHGDNSLIYVSHSVWCSTDRPYSSGTELSQMSFGSIWWPKDEYVRVFVEVLLELEIPFVGRYIPFLFFK